MMYISKKDQDYLKEQLYKMSGVVKLVVFGQEFECQYCRTTREIITELSRLSKKITIENFDFVKDREKAERYKIDKIPAIIIEGKKDYGVRYFGVPGGYEFATLVENILDVSRGSTDLKSITKDQLQQITKPVHVQVFVTPTCPYCPPAVRMAHKMAIESDMVISDMIEVTEFPQLAIRHQISTVPQIIINDKIKFAGAQPESTFLAKIVEAAGNNKAK